jgi:hypothetical protein
MTQTLVVRITKNYGQEAIYPVDETAELFTKLTGKKTFSRSELNQIKQLGYEINVMAEVL